jgi:hypothetical protein
MSRVTNHLKPTIHKFKAAKRSNSGFRNFRNFRANKRSKAATIRPPPLDLSSDLCQTHGNLDDRPTAPTAGSSARHQNAWGDAGGEWSASSSEAGSTEAGSTEVRALHMGLTRMEVEDIDSMMMAMDKLQDEQEEDEAQDEAQDEDAPVTMNAAAGHATKEEPVAKEKNRRVPAKEAARAIFEMLRPVVQSTPDTQ